VISSPPPKNTIYSRRLTEDSSVDYSRKRETLAVTSLPFAPLHPRIESNEVITPASKKDTSVFDDQFPSKFVDLGGPEDMNRNTMLRRTSFDIRVDPSPQKQRDDGDFSGIYAR
jgi:hypothetical protein